MQAVVDFPMWAREPDPALEFMEPAESRHGISNPVRPVPLVPPETHHSQRSQAVVGFPSTSKQRNTFLLAAVNVCSANPVDILSLYVRRAAENPFEK
jgi:hypothetical protein